MLWYARSPTLRQRNATKINVYDVVQKQKSD